MNQWHPLCCLRHRRQWNSCRGRHVRYSEDPIAVVSPSPGMMNINDVSHAIDLRLPFTAWTLPMALSPAAPLPFRPFFHQY